MQKSKKHILVVDDEVTIRTLLINIIGKKYEVTTAKEDSLQALNWIQEGNISDLIICDIKMPGLGGYQFVKNIRTNSFYNDIPLLIFSGKEDSKTRN